ncbi:hypothetical protein DR64_8730 [Paraburkholderia xenovorans LB400]|uniref:Uncharacterized protein n=1 Tax=Paraburkholderia xenovorans (strain LB400) TaxID=266265 RepID=Q13G52_PARXL|nr:hypothetical protein [Paraburkholderia xenovorans]ABE36937.1 hypothetical protein Bxe_C1070 [Paraburkholderia xenovorans LB400]AIP33973.1 hypothetical protein DR64_8730 [Paraburkholderia xenovorans LB400]
MTAKEFIQESAALRGQGKYQEAIDVIKANLPKTEGNIRLDARIEAIRAAVEAGDAMTAYEYATAIAAEESGRPRMLTVALTDGALRWPIGIETTTRAPTPKKR